MKTSKKIKSLRQLLLMCALLLGFSCSTFLLFRYTHDDSRRFEEITSDLFTNEMRANTLNMHYTIAFPEDFGIKDYTPVLSCYNRADTLAGQMSYENILKSLSETKPSKLDASEQYTYKLLVRSLQNSLELSKYSYYDEPLSPSSGAQSQLPILLAEYTFRSRRDVEDYLALLSQTGKYFDSLLTYEQEKADEGLLMSYISLKNVEEQCDTIINSDELKNNTHFLQTTFAERLDELLAEKIITDAKKEEYIQENNRLLAEVLLPAYIRLSDGLFLLEDKAGDLEGLAAKPDGADYYRLYLISQTGSYRDVSEIKQLLLTTFTEEWNSIQSLLSDNPNAAQLYDADTDIDFPYQDADSMIADLKIRMKNDFPALPDSDGSDEVLKIKTVSSCLEEYCAPAFYLTAPIDDTDDNVIYINQKNAPDNLELYTTLAHEGYPGHLYQTVYSNRTFINTGADNIRQLLWYGGYLEGWALYVEFISYDYASDMYSDAGNDDTAVIVQLEKHNRSLILCLYSILDIMINYENASTNQVAEVLSSLGISSASTVQSVYEYIAEEPCNYLKYYLGYLEICKLQDRAKTLWQSDYTDMRFHTFFLDSGSSDFTSLNELLEDTAAY
jgi:uncharacterized protein (DUF885 family)